MMICPAPGAIEVVRTEKPGEWKPVIYPGHCIRCGLCVEICPELVLDAGRVHTKNAQDGIYAVPVPYHRKPGNLHGLRKLHRGLPG